MRFKPGQSGNPNGRPPGALPPTARLRQSISESIPEIINTLVNLAKAGDVGAAKLLLDRVCAPLKPQALSVRRPVNESLANQGAEIIKATISGQIPPDIGSQLINALAAQSKFIEIEELTKRVEALEHER